MWGVCSGPLVCRKVFSRMTGVRSLNSSQAFCMHECKVALLHNAIHNCPPIVLNRMDPDKGIRVTVQPRGA